VTLTLTPLFEAILILAGLTASGTDIWWRRIPNSLCAATFAFGLAYAWHLGGLSELGSHLLHALIALMIGMGLFALGGIGGGDAKFYAAVAAWFGLKLGMLLFATVSLSGLVLLVIWFTARRLAGKPFRQNGKSAGLPYGVAIAAGGLIVLLWQ
jgi:prepilin peptidase CpaA